MAETVTETITSCDRVICGCSLPYVIDTSIIVVKLQQIDSGGHWCPVFNCGMKLGDPFVAFGVFRVAFYALLPFWGI